MQATACTRIPVRDTFAFANPIEKRAMRGWSIIANDHKEKGLDRSDGNYSYFYTISTRIDRSKKNKKLAYVLTVLDRRFVQSTRFSFLFLLEFLPISSPLQRSYSFPRFSNRLRAIRGVRTERKYGKRKRNDSLDLNAPWPRGNTSPSFVCFLPWRKACCSCSNFSFSFSSLSFPFWFFKIEPHRTTTARDRGEPAREE